MSDTGSSRHAELESPTPNETNIVGPMHETNDNRKHIGCVRKSCTVIGGGLSNAPFPEAAA